MNVRRLPPETYYRIRDPKNFYSAMRSDVHLLLKSYLSLTTVIVQQPSSGGSKQSGTRHQFAIKTRAFKGVSERMGCGKARQGKGFWLLTSKLTR